MKFLTPNLAIPFAGVIWIFWLLWAKENQPREISQSEKIPSRIVISESTKLGGEIVMAIDNQKDIIELMKAMPYKYEEPFCACFETYILEFYDKNDSFRTLRYKPGEYLRDSKHRKGQAGVPRRFDKKFDELTSKKR